CQVDKVGSSSKHSVGNAFSFPSKSNYLLEDSFPFFVHTTTCLKHNRSKVVVRLLERGVSGSLLGLSVRLTWFQRMEVRGCERGDYGNIARPRWRLQCLMETSPGRRRDLSVGPKIPSFSFRERGGRYQSLNTRFRRLLCLVILSPDF